MNTTSFIDWLNSDACPSNESDLRDLIVASKQKTRCGRYELLAKNGGYVLKDFASVNSLRLTTDYAYRYFINTIKPSRLNENFEEFIDRLGLSPKMKVDLTAYF